jgi:hypothetical protein
METLHRNGIEIGPSQADVAQEAIVEMPQGQNLTVGGDTAPPEQGGEKQNHQYLLFQCFQDHRNSWQNKSGGILRLGPVPDVRAALVGQEADEGVHRRVVGPADESCGLPFLRHQPSQQEPLEVMRERRARNAEALLDLPDREARLSGPHKGAVDLEPGGVPERFELLGCLFDVHGNKMRQLPQDVKRYFQKFRNNRRLIVQRQCFSGHDGRLP